MEKAIITSLETLDLQFIHSTSVIYTIRTDETYFQFSPNNPRAIFTEENIACIPIQNAYMYE
jgi:hypothetical protein